MIVPDKHIDWIGNIHYHIAARSHADYLWYYHHREDGPAIESEYHKVWYLNNKRHRLYGPAIEYANGTKEWWVNGKLHRLDGPAIEQDNAEHYWYFNGEPVHCDSQQEFERLIKLKAFW